MGVVVGRGWLLVATFGCRVGRVGGCIGVCRSIVVLGLGLGFIWVGFSGRGFGCGLGWLGWVGFRFGWFWVEVVVVTCCVGVGFCRLLVGFGVAGWGIGGTCGVGGGGKGLGVGGLGSILLNLVMNFRIELVGWSWLQVRRRGLVIVGFCCCIIGPGLVGWGVLVASLVFIVFMLSFLCFKIWFSGLARSLSFPSITTASSISALADGWWGCWPTKFSIPSKYIPVLSISEPLPLNSTSVARTASGSCWDSPRSSTASATP